MKLSGLRNRTFITASGSANPRPSWNRALARWYGRQMRGANARRLDRSRVAARARGSFSRRVSKPSG
jgi:hypothetical protein